MYLIKPSIVQPSSPSIELVDNLNQIVSGKALDARQGKVLKDMIPSMPDLSGYAKKTDLTLHSLYAGANNFIAYLSILSSVNTETKVIDLTGDKDSFILNTNSYKISAGSRCTITVEGFSPVNGLAIFNPTCHYDFSIIPYPLVLSANKSFTYKCRFENMYDITKRMINIGKLQIVYLS